MNWKIEQYLKELHTSYFSALNPEERAVEEARYRAFAARLMCETHIEGGAYEGVIYGCLALKNSKALLETEQPTSQ